MGAIYSDEDQPTTPNNESKHTTFKDGVVIEYDPESSTLTAKGVKDVVIEGTGDLTATMDGNVNIKQVAALILQAQKSVLILNPPSF